MNQFITHPISRRYDKLFNLVGNTIKRTSTCLAGVLLVLLLSACSLAEDITPPASYRPTLAPTAIPVSAMLPQQQPDLANGKVIFAEKCADCHGDTGMGDGPSGAQLPQLPPALADPEIAHKALPLDWFWVVTTGRMQNYMPNFSGSLDSAARWDVVTYALSLSTTAEELKRGQAIFDAACADCHAAGSKADLTVPAALVQLSSQQLVQVIQQGKGDMAAMPDLAERDAWAVTAYSRSLATLPGNLDGVVVALPGDATPVAQVPADSGFTINGTVNNASGSDLPEGLTVRLMRFDGMQMAGEQSTTLQSDGRFTFTGLESLDGTIYIASVTINGYDFPSDMVNSLDVLPGSGVDLPIPVYETTSDPSGLMAQRMHIFFEYSKPGVVQVVELFIVSNPTDRVVIPKESGEPALQFKLPVDATNLQLEGGSMGERFVNVAGGFGDTLGILPDPNQHQVLFGYEVPYDRKRTVVIELPIMVESLVVAIPAQGVKLESDLLVESGSRDIQGSALKLYSGSDLAAGTRLEIALSGMPKEASGVKIQSGTTTNLLIGLGVFIIVAGLAVWMYARPRQEAAGEQTHADLTAVEMDSQEGLLDEILAVDDQYKSGKLPEKAYRQRRAELKMRLSNLRGKQA
jgi:mono/diheme cytochrome c family protein